MSRNKGVGLAAFDRLRLTSAQYAVHGSALRTRHADSLAAQLAVFRSLLQQFARTHARDIRSDPAFRAEFARMCAAIGVDPLAGSNRSGGGGGGGGLLGIGGSSGGSGGNSLWAQLLGGTVNDFYFELAVRVVEVCGVTREENGGLIGVREVRDRLARTGMEGAAEITEDDILRAVRCLSPLGSSYATVLVGSRTYIRSVPKELNTDQSAVLEAAQLLGYVSVSMLMLNLRWLRARAKTAIDDLVAEGMLWVDKQCGGDSGDGEWEYWSPGFMLEGGEIGA